MHRWYGSSSSDAGQTSIADSKPTFTLPANLATSSTIPADALLPFFMQRRGESIFSARIVDGVFTSSEVARAYMNPNATVAFVRSSASFNLTFTIPANESRLWTLSGFNPQTGGRISLQPQFSSSYIFNSQDGPISTTGVLEAGTYTLSGLAQTGVFYNSSSGLPVPGTVEARYNISFGLSAVPTPTVAGLLGLGGLLAARRRR